jgi:hypothetical protein
MYNLCLIQFLKWHNCRHNKHCWNVKKHVILSKSPVEVANETGRPSRGVGICLSGQRNDTEAEGLDADPHRQASRLQVKVGHRGETGQGKAHVLTRFFHVHFHVEIQTYI